MKKREIKPLLQLNNRKNVRSGYTLIELVVVIALIGAVGTLLAVRLQTVSYWKEEAFLRRFSTTVSYVYHQAVMDQAYYRLDILFKDRAYRVRVIKPETDISGDLAEIAPRLGNLSLELATYLSPSIGESYTLIPPPSIPSLAEPVYLPAEAKFIDVITDKGKILPSQRQLASVIFTPRGFSQFAVIHIRFGKTRTVTILIDPFSGLTKLYREYKEFKWTYHSDENA